MKTSIVPLVGVSQKTKLEILSLLFPNEDQSMAPTRSGNVLCHCLHPELASCGDIWQEVKEICPATFLISEGKNNYLWSWLTPCGSVN